MLKKSTIDKHHFYLIFPNIFGFKGDHFYLIFPNIFGFKGGIQVYSTFLLKALQDVYPEADYDVFLKYDKHNLGQPQNLQFLTSTKFHYFGDLPRLLQTIFFAAKIIVLAIFKRPTVVISTHVNYGVACYILKLLTGIPYWVVAHGLELLTGIPYWVVAHGLEVWDIENNATKLALQKADKIISVSNYTSQRLLEDKNIDSEKIVLLPNTFDAKKFQINPKPTYLLKRYNLTDEQPVILTVTRMGRMAKYKGYDQILHALVKIRLHIPNVHFILAGKGDDLPRISALVTSLNLQDCVTIAGFVPDEELCAYYNLCDVFALPSKGEGFLVDPDNIEEIADNLIQILQGNFSNPVVYQPEYLQQKTIEAFDFSQFRTSLAKLIAGH